MMNIQSVSFTGRDYTHAVREAKSSKNWRAMEKQIKSNKAKIDNMVLKLKDPSIPNAEKKSILAKVNRLIDDNDRMSEIIDNHR